MAVAECRKQNGVTAERPANNRPQGARHKVSGPLPRDVGRKQDKMKTQDKSLVILFIAAIAATSSLNGQETPPAQVQPTLYSLKCVDAPLEVLLDRLQEVTGKTITVDLGVEARFTLKTAGKATASEMVDLITHALTAQGIRLENLDENTIRVRGTTNPRDAKHPRLRAKPREYTQQEMDVHLQNYQMQLVRDGQTPLDVQLTPENIAILKSEGVAVPASVGGDKIPTHENE